MPLSARPYLLDPRDPLIQQAMKQILRDYIYDECQKPELADCDNCSRSEWYGYENLPFCGVCVKCYCRTCCKSMGSGFCLECDKFCCRSWRCKNAKTCEFCKEMCCKECIYQHTKICEFAHESDDYGSDLDEEDDGDEME